MVYENMPDDLCAEGKELHTAFAADAVRANQFEIRLIHHGCGLKCVSRKSAGEVLPRNSLQFWVDEGHQTG
jgi:hypothetical protein